MLSSGTTNIGGRSVTQSEGDASALATHPIVGQLAEGAHHAVDSVAGVAAHAAQTLDEKGQQLRAAPSHLIDRCCSQIRSRPFVSLALAMTSGFLMGWLLRQR
jgi:ElaB/YqjD/DUF883 family membrane-anchored ribosome-binding protein